MSNLPSANDRDGHTSGRSADKNDRHAGSPRRSFALTAPVGLRRCPIANALYEPAALNPDGQPDTYYCQLCDEQGRKRGQAGYNPARPGQHWYPPMAGTAGHQQLLDDARRDVDDLLAPAQRLRSARDAYVLRIIHLYRHGRRADEDQAGSLVAA